MTGDYSVSQTIEKFTNFCDWWGGEGGRYSEEKEPNGSESKMSTRIVGSTVRNSTKV